MTLEAAPSGDWPRDELEAVPRCPLCESRERALLHDRLRDLLFGRAPGLWTLYRCRGCGAGYLDPRPIASSIGRAYGDYYTHDRTPPEEAPVGRWKLALRNGYLNRRYGYTARPAIPLPGPLVTSRVRRKADRSIRHLRFPGEAHRRLLDLGCGNGSFLARMQRLGWEGVGLEPDRQAVLAARSAGLPIEHGVLTDSRFAPDYFKAVTMNHVIEHLHDPPGMLALCHRVLRPGGLLWIATPNLDSLGHRRFGPLWRGLEPPRHVVLFTFDALRGALRRAGFEAAAPLPGTGARWMYRSSARLRIGGRQLPAPERLFLKWLAHRADRRALLQPELAEEIVLLARRP